MSACYRVPSLDGLPRNFLQTGADFGSFISVVPARFGSLRGCAERGDAHCTPHRALVSVPFTAVYSHVYSCSSPRFSEAAAFTR